MRTPVFLRNNGGPPATTWSLDFQAAALEFCGTFLFLLLGLGGIQAAVYSNQDSLQAAQDAPGGVAVNTITGIEQFLYISVSMGLSLLITIWLFYRVTSGFFNPNVCTALLLAGTIGPARWALCCIAQLAGAIAASGVLLALLPGSLVSNTRPGPGVNKAQAVFIEMFLTSALVLSVLMLVAAKHRSIAFAPIGIGLTYFTGHLFGLLFTGASMNTARSFGPAVVSGFHNTHWIYWLGPFLGSLLAAFFYLGVTRLRFWRVNTDLDTTHPATARSGPVDPLGPGTSLNGGVVGDGHLRASNITAAANEGYHYEKALAPPGQVHAQGPVV